MCVDMHACACVLLGSACACVSVPVHVVIRQSVCARVGTCRCRHPSICMCTCRYLSMLSSVDVHVRQYLSMASSVDLHVHVHQYLSMSCPPSICMCMCVSTCRWHPSCPCCHPSICMCMCLSTCRCHLSCPCCHPSICMSTCQYLSMSSSVDLHVHMSVHE